jgi:hypothetical protein
MDYSFVCYLHHMRFFIIINLKILFIITSFARCYMAETRYKIYNLFFLSLLIISLLSGSIKGGIEQLPAVKTQKAIHSPCEEDNKHHANKTFLKSISFVAIVPLSIIHLDILHDFICGPIVFPLENSGVYSIPGSGRYINQYFKTLFQFIISPNAP